MPAEVIEVYQRPLPGTRTPTLACKWEARCTVGGKTYIEESRHGATHELARALKNAGLADAELIIRNEGWPGHLSVPSFYRWAEWTYKGERRVPYARVLVDRERLKGLR